jgi:hypothetical protein
MCSRDKKGGSRTVLLNVENGKLICRAMDDIPSITIEYAVELYETENQINEPISAPVNDLATLIKSARDEKFIIRKCFNQCEFAIIGGGWMPFRTADSDLSKYDLKGDISDIGKLNSAKLKNAIGSVLGYTQEYTYARDRYIQFSPTQMAVTSRLSNVVMADEFVTMTLHRDDAMMLRSLLKDNFDLEIKKVLSDTNERYLFIGPKFRFTVIASAVDSGDIKYRDDLKNYLKIDCEELFKLVSFSEEYSASKQVVGLSVKDKKLNISIKNVLAAKHCSTINSTPVGDVEDTSKEATIPSHNLLKALKLFQDKHSRDVNIYITDKMIDEQNNIVLFDNNTQANISISNR